MKKMIPQSVKNIYHLGQAFLANIYFGWPGKKIKIIGITGTNGKTTTTQMIGHILEKGGRKIALASTINFKIGDKKWVNKTKFTTLNSWETLKFIRRAVNLKCEFVVLEVASHALDQFRVWGVSFDTAIVTNVTREHLDYHKSMENYRETKMRLFRKARVAVVNLDMEKPEEFLQFQNEKKYGYMIKSQKLKVKSQNFDSDIKNFKAEEIELGLNHTNYKLQTKNYKLNIPGIFNVENALAATCVGKEYGVSEEKIKKALETIKNIPGRLESVSNDLGINIIIDYAVTPDSLEKLYGYIKETQGDNCKIIAVFGSCGERDRGKRPIMGKIVDENADYIFLTNEDPFNEDPWRIINEVSEGVKNKKEGENFYKIMDRREAIFKALKIAKKGDIIVVTGKGAEETMAQGKERIPWNDKKVILEELQKI